MNLGFDSYDKYKVKNDFIIDKSNKRKGKEDNFFEKSSQHKREISTKLDAQFDTYSETLIG